MTKGKNKKKFGECVVCKNDMRPLVYYKSWNHKFVVTRVFCDTCQTGRPLFNNIVVEQQPAGYEDKR